MCETIFQVKQKNVVYALTCIRLQLLDSYSCLHSRSALFHNTPYGKSINQFGPGTFKNSKFDLQSKRIHAATKFTSTGQLTGTVDLTTSVAQDDHILNGQIQEKEHLSFSALLFSSQEFPPFLHLCLHYQISCFL